MDIGRNLNHEMWLRGGCRNRFSRAVVAGALCCDSGGTGYAAWGKNQNIQRRWSSMQSVDCFDGLFAVLPGFWSDARQEFDSERQRRHFSSEASVCRSTTESVSGLSI